MALMRRFRLFPFRTPVTRRRPQLSRPRARPMVEALESRLVLDGGAPDPTKFVALGELGFLNDAGYLHAGNNYTFTGPDVEMGYAPEPGEAFEPVYLIDGTVTFTYDSTKPFDPAQTFTVNGSFEAPDTDHTVLWDGNATFKVEDLLKGNLSLENPLSIKFSKNFQFTVTTLALSGPNGEPGLHVQGSITFPFINNCPDDDVNHNEHETAFTVAVDHLNYLVDGPNGFYLTGLSVSVTGCINIFGLEIQPKDLTLGYATGDGDDAGKDQQFFLYGGLDLAIGFVKPPEDVFDDPQQTEATIISAQLGTGPASPGLLIENGDLKQIDFTLSGALKVGPVKLSARSLTLVYKNEDGADVFELGGGAAVSLTDKITAAVTFGTPQSPGIVVDDGHFNLNAVKFELDDVHLGAFTLHQFDVFYNVDADDNVTVGGSVNVIFPRGWSLGGEVAWVNGSFDDVAINYSAEQKGEGEGVPVAESGLFIIGAGLHLQNLATPSNLVFTGSLVVDYGGKVKIGKIEAYILRAEGSVTIDKDKFVLSADVSFGGYKDGDKEKSILGGGNGLLDLEWGAGLYRAEIHAALLDSTITFDGTFALEVGQSISIYAGAALNVPAGIPLIGGDHIASGQLVFKYFRVPSDVPGGGDSADGYIAGLGSIVGLSAGFEYVLAGDDAPSLHSIGADQFNDLLTGTSSSSSPYSYPSTLSVPSVGAPAGSGSANTAPAGATTVTFSVTWPADVGGTQSLRVKLPNGTTIDQADFNPAANGLRLVPDLPAPDGVPAPPGEHILTVQLAGSAADDFAPLPAGPYTFSLISTEKLAAAPGFSYTYGFPVPRVTVTDVTPDDPLHRPYLLHVQLGGRVAAPLADAGQLALYFDPDGDGYDGVPVADQVPLGPGAVGAPAGSFTANLAVDLTRLAALPYGPGFFYANVKDGTGNASLSAYAHAAVQSLYTSAGQVDAPVGGLVRDVADGRHNALAGITVYITTDPTGAYHAGDYTVQTNGQGQYQFLKPAAGDATNPNPPFVDGQQYWVGVIGLDPGYDLAPGDPNTSPQAFTFSSNEATQTLDFDLRQRTSLTGTVFADLNQNGRQDPADPAHGMPAEQGVDGIQVYLDLNNNGQHDADEPTATTRTTNLPGSYTFLNVDPATDQDPNHQRAYTIRLLLDTTAYFVPPADPTSRTGTVGTDPYGQAAGLIFGVAPFTTVTGSVAAIPLAGGSQESPGVTVQLTGTAFSGAAVAATTTTDGDGNYTFTRLVPGTYTVSQQVPAGYREVEPLAAKQVFTSQFQVAATNNSGQPDQPVDAVVADLDGDHVPDLVAVAKNDFDVTVFWGKPGGGYQGSIRYQPGNADSNNLLIRVAVGDVDDDGRPDIVTLDFQGTVRVSRNLGGRNFTQSNGHATSDINPHGGKDDLDTILRDDVGPLLLADLDGDGKADLAYTVRNKSGDWELVLGLSARTKTTFGTLIELAAEGRGLAIGDLFHDGKPQILSWNKPTLDHKKLAIFEVIPPTSGIGEFPFFGYTLSGGNVYYGFDKDHTNFGHIAVADLNGDGWADVVVEAWEDGDPVRLGYWLNPHGRDFVSKSINSFPSLIATETDRGLPVPALADFDGDGHVDVAAVARSGEAPPLVHLYPNLAPSFPGDPLFTADTGRTTTYAGSSAPDALGVADLNGDGLPDLLLSDSHQGGFQFLLSSFDAPAGLPVTAVGTEVALAEFVNAQLASIEGLVFVDANANGAREAADRGLAGVMVFLDVNGNGVFDPGVDRRTVTGPHGVYTFDGVPRGSYLVRVVAPAGYRTTIAGGALQAVINNRAPAAGLDFGLAPRLVHDLADRTVPEQTPLSFTVTPTGAGQGRPLDFRLIEGPAGARLNPRTGVFTWTPTAAQANHDARVRVAVADASNLLYREEVSAVVHVTATPSATRFVQALYTDMLGRPADAAGLSTWVRFLSAGHSRLEVATAFELSAEHRGLEVDAFYRRYMHRRADAAGRSLWVTALVRGLGEAEVQVAFVTAPEYTAAHPSMTSFLTGLYADALGRPVDAGALGSWSLAFLHGATRETIARAVLTSDEAYLKAIAQSYTTYLHRQGSHDELIGLLARVRQQRWSYEQITEAFLASDEYFVRA